jgi:hypothetical protein
LRGIVDIVVKDNGSAIIERVSQWDGRLDPLQAVRRKGQAAEKRGSDGHGINGGTEIVHEAGHGQPGGSCATADGILSFQGQDRTACLRNGYCGSQSVGTASNYNGIILLA